MLRSMVIHNFISFRDLTTLQFDQGPNLFIGCNCTGKSSVLELVRRCLGDKLSSSVSSSYDEDKDAFVFCLYDVTDDDKSDFENASQLITAVVKTVKPSGKLTKLVLLNTEKVIEVHSASYEIRDQELHTPQEGRECSFSMRENDMFKILNDITKEGKEIQEKIKKTSKIIFEELEEKSLQSNESKITYYLGKLSEKYVTTFSMRSIGPLQWSRSGKIKPPEDNKNKNYIEASERAEILQELLNCQYVNRELDKDIFNFLTHPIEYDFKKEGAIFTVTNISLKSIPYSLLKCPEGILEARQFSLIMSDERFRTICLEEPDRGMHPQMIERMQICLRTMKQKKVVIIVTHNPAFINTMNVKSTHMFYREQPNLEDQEAQKGSKTNGQKKRKITHLKMIHRIHSTKDIAPRITDTDDMKKVLFASKILTVEGKTDKKVIESIFEQLLQKVDFRLDGEIHLKMKEKHKIVSHQIIHLGGGHVEISKTFPTVYIPTASLVDRDQQVVMEKDKPIIQKIHNSEALNKKWKGKNVEEFLKEDFLLLSQILQEKNIFTWKFGEIEDTIRSALTKERFKDFFPENATNKNIKSKLTEMEGEKLFKLSEYLLEDQEIVRFIKFLLNQPDSPDQIHSSSQ